MLEDFRGIPSSSKMIILGSFFSQLAVGTVLTDLAFFLTTVRHINAVFAGLLFTVEGISSVVFSIPLGIISDAYGRKKFLLLGNGAIGVATIVLAITSSQPLLLLGGFLAGISEASFIASSGALLADTAGEQKRTPTFALFSLAGNLAFASGGFLLYVLAPLVAFGFTPVQAHVILYVTLAALTFASTVFFVRVKEVRMPRQRVAGAKRLILSSGTRSILTKYIVANVFVAFGAGLVVPLMSQWFEYRYGVPDSVSGPILGISNLMLAVSTLAAPAVARRLGLVRTIVYTQAASTVFMVLTPIPNQYQVAGGVYIVRAFLMNVSSPLSQSLIMGLVPHDERGAASGISSAFWRAPNAISTYPGSALMKEGYLSAPFFIASGLYLISISLFYAWFRGSKLPEEVKNRSTI